MPSKVGKNIFVNSRRGDILSKSSDVEVPILRTTLSAFRCTLAPKTIHHTPYTEHDEGDAEELAHIERHAYLEVGLYLLEELHEEAEGEDGGEAVAKEETCAHLAGHMLVEIPADESEQQVRNSFIELSWMARQHVDLCEDESEVTTSRTANNLGVHQIAQADAAGSDRCGNGNIVEHRPQGYFVLAHIEP